MKQPFQALLLLPLALAGIAANAADIAFSGYGTAGYAISNQPYAYQRYIDDKGTFARDSVFGVQMDAAIAPRWSATLQLKLAPDVGHDSGWAPTLAWGFVSWRPNDDWLLRAGKLRIPFYLHSENLDVGTSFDYARLPIEMYSMAPTSDFTGASFVKSWDVRDGELSLDGYWGKARTDWRDYSRDGVPGYLAAGANINPIDVTARGLALTYREDSNLFRIGLHKASVKRTDGESWIDGPVLLNPAPGVSYYTLLPGPGVAERKTMDMMIANAGLDIGLGHNVRLAAEYAIRKTIDMDRGLNSAGGYLSLRKQIGKWTPYVYYAQLHSDKDMIDLYQAVNHNTVPSWVPNSALLNASQRTLADAVLVFDQRSWAAGTAYALTPTSKLKAEWMGTRIGSASSLVDAPYGSNISNQRINVFSLSYSFTF